VSEDYLLKKVKNAKTLRVCSGRSFGTSIDQSEQEGHWQGGGIMVSGVRVFHEITHQKRRRCPTEDKGYQI